MSITEDKNDPTICTLTYLGEHDNEDMDITATKEGLEIGYSTLSWEWIDRARGIADTAKK